MPKKGPIVAAIKQLENKINVLIAFQTMESNLSQEKKIKRLDKMGLGYTEIEKILGVSSKTISKALKKTRKK